MKFKLGKKSVIFKGKFMTLWGREFFDKAAKSQIWEYIEKADVVVVLPITDDGKAVLVKSYRVPLDKYVIETPAGMVDKEGEGREEAIKRELREETGYEASEWHALPPWPYRSGTSKNLTYGFIAKGLKKVGDEAGDDTEDISVMEVPLNELVDLFLKSKEDVLFQPEIVAMYKVAIDLGIIKQV